MLLLSYGLTERFIGSGASPIDPWTPDPHYMEDFIPLVKSRSSVPSTKENNRISPITRPK